MLSLLLQIRAQLEGEAGDMARAREFLAESLRIARERSLLESEGWASGAFSILDWIDGDTQVALPHCLQAVEIAERLGSSFSTAHALGLTAPVVASSGDGKTALDRARHYKRLEVVKLLENAAPTSPGK